MTDDTPMTPEERRRLITAPITVGILATLHDETGARATYGAGSDGPREAVRDRFGNIVGWRVSARPML